MGNSRLPVFDTYTQLKNGNKKTFAQQTYKNLSRIFALYYYIMYIIFSSENTDNIQNGVKLIHFLQCMVW